MRLVTFLTKGPRQPDRSNNNHVLNYGQDFSRKIPPLMKPYAKVTFYYLLFGFLWIALSDEVLKRLPLDQGALTGIQTCKGWFFVAISSVLIYLLARRFFISQNAKEQEKKDVYNTTLQGVYHIVFNYMNNMQFILRQAERHGSSDAETIALAKASSKDAAEALRKLQDISEISATKIDAVLYPAKN